MFLAMKYRKQDSLVDNPAFDKETMDPNDENNPDPKILERKEILERTYIENDRRTVQRNLGVVDEIDYYEIVDRGRGQIELVPVG